jgi:hypothetical protein
MLPVRLQHIIREFGSDDEVWGKAVLRLASIRQTHEHDAEMAISLLESVAQRLKFTGDGRQARDRLKDLRSQLDS